MSTYLLAFVVAEFDTTVSHLDDTFAAIHMNGKGDQTWLALDSGPRIIEYYNTYFDVEFPLPKMDMAAIPDFNAGAMENCKNSYLLFNNFC